MSRPSRRGIGPNTRSSAKAHQRASPIGSLVIQPDGRSEFYPEGGTNRMPSRRADRRPVKGPPISRGEKDDPESALGTQAIYYNSGFKKEDFVLESPGDDDDQDALNQPSFISPTAMLKSCIICGFVSVIVFIVIAMTIIFPVVYIASNSQNCNLSCANSGVLNETACSCDCATGFTGTTCDTSI